MYLNMKNLRYNILVLSIIVLLVSCNKREDYFKIENIDPVATELKLSYSTGNVDLTSNPIIISDTLKRSLSNTYKFNITLDDEVDAIKVSARIYEGSGSSKANTQYLTNSVTLSGKDIDISYVPSINGLHVVDYTFEDVYGKVTIVRLRLFCFSNTSPIANFTFNNTQLFNPNEYRITATNSYDTDARFGGKIVEYEFKVGLYYDVTTSNSYINHIFSGAGTYAIKVRAKDNDGAWSDYKTNIIVIN
jgi:hypothetical protein